MKRFWVKAVSVLISAAILLPVISGCTKVSAILPLENLINIAAYSANLSEEDDFSLAISAASDACLSKNSVLYFPKGRYKILASVTLPAGVSVVVDKGAVFEVANGVTFRIESLVFEAPSVTVFEGEGVVCGFSPYVSVKTEWFGGITGDGNDDSAAIAKALYASNGVLYLSSGVYDLKSTVCVDAFAMENAANSLIVRGKGAGKTTVKIWEGITAFENKTEENGANGYYFENITFEGDGTGEALYLMKQVYLSGCEFKNLSRGLFANKAGMSSILNNSAYKVSGNVFEIGDDTMFIYFSKNSAEECGTLIRVKGGGVRTTGIQITNCTTKNMTDYDIWLYAGGGDTNYVDGCRFEGGTGKAFIYMESVQFPHVTETEIIGANNGKKGIEINNCTHAVYVNKNVISGVSEAVSVLAASWVTISENLLFGNECDISLYSAFGVSVNSNYLFSDKVISGYGVNKSVTVTDNLLKNAAAKINEAFATPELITAENNNVTDKAPLASEIISENKKLSAEPIIREEVITRLPTTEKNTVSLLSLCKEQSAYDALCEAINKLKKGGMIIIEAGEYEITKSITVPENITLAILQGAVLNISEGQTLEILSTDVSYFAPTEIFNGKVTLKNADYALSEWFGANRNVNDDSSKAVEAAIESGASVVRLLGGKYIFEGKASVNEGASVKVIGEGHGKTYLSARNKITYFALNAADGDSFAVSSLTVDGNGKTATLVSANGKNEGANACVEISDVFAIKIETVINTNGISGGVTLSDLYVSNSKNPYIFNATDNVLGVRSLTVTVSEYTMQINGKKQDGKTGEGYRFVNFCSVESRKNLSVKDISGFYYFASGYDFAIGDYEATLRFENVENGVFESCYVTSANNYGALLINCKNFRIAANVMTEHKDSIRIEGSENIEITDNWFFRCTKTAIYAIDSENVLIRGNLFPYSSGIDGTMFDAEGNGEISFVANIFNKVNESVGSGFKPTESRGNVTDTVESIYKEALQKLPLEDYAALVSAEHGNINRPTKAGAVIAENKKVTLKGFSDGWFSNAGITSKERVLVNGLTLKVTMIRDGSEETSKSRNFTVELSKDSPEKITSAAREWYGDTNAENAISISFFFSEKGITVQTRLKGELLGASYKKRTVLAFESDEMPQSAELEIEFKANGADLSITANGARIAIKDGAALLGESAYLTAFIQSYGSASLSAEITEINGSKIK